MRIIIKNNQTSLCQSSNPLLNSFSLEKLVDSIANFHIRRLKSVSSIFSLGKVNAVYFFWITPSEWAKVFCFYICTLSLTFCNTLVCLKIEKCSLTVSLVSTPSQLASSYGLQYYKINTLFFMLHCVSNFFKPVFEPLIL